MKIYLLLILISGPAWGAAYNLRELCRERVAGLYLNLVDQVAIAQPRLELLKKKSATLIKEKKTTGSNLTKSKELLKSNPTDIALRDRVQAEESKLATMVYLLEENQKTSAQISLEWETSKNALKKFEQSLGPVFVITKILDKRPRGYPFKVEYARPCQRFEEGCALNAKEKEHLRSMFKQLEMPESCEKYLNINEAAR